MKLVAYGDDRIGVVEGSSVYEVTAVAPEGLRDLRVHMNWLIGNWETALPALRRLREEATAAPLARVRLLPPSPAPSHIFVDAPSKNGFALKAPGSLAAPDESIRLPQAAGRRTAHRPALAAIIGSRVRNAPRAEALRHVFGYTCLLEAGMDERAPMGPCLVTADEVNDPQALGLRLWVNGRLRVDAASGELIDRIATLIERASSALPLNPGDVVVGSLAEGGAALNPGDRVRVAIDRVGEMTLAVTLQA